MAVHYFSIAPGKDRDFETELPNAGAHAVNGGVVLSGITDVEHQAVDVPDLNLKRAGRGHHALNSNSGFQSSTVSYRLLNGG
jgi:hypothetical protein